MLVEYGLEWQADVMDAGQINVLVDKAISTLGKLDILVNNAGIGFTKPMIVTPGLEKLVFQR